MLVIIQEAQLLQRNSASAIMHFVIAGIYIAQ